MPSLYHRTGAWLACSVVDGPVVVAVATAPAVVDGARAIHLVATLLECSEEWEAPLTGSYSWSAGVDVDGAPVVPSAFCSDADVHATMLLCRWGDDGAPATRNDSARLVAVWTCSAVPQCGYVAPFTDVHAS
jgi:hypothetical protein